MTMLRSGRTRVTSPSFPRSFPDRTRTRSPLRRRILGREVMSEHLRGQRDDPHESPVAQLPADGPENAGAARLHLLVDEHRGVLVEADVAAVGAATFLLGADDDAFDDFALLDRGAGGGVLDGRDEHVTDSGGAASCS